MDGTWALILAAGDGTRLQPLTRLLYGEPLPKQFAEILSGRSLLQTTVERVSRLVPPERMVVVVAAKHHQLARRQLADWRDVHVVAQPANLGTGPGILLPLAHVHAADGAARVVVFPSDHYLERADLFLSAVSRAASAASGELALVGAEATYPEVEYGWIVPQGGGDGVALQRVARFVEKPNAAVAHGLLHANALWNTFVVAGTLDTFWELARTYLPAHVRAFEAYAATRPEARSAELERIYRRLPEANFSRSVLERSAELRVARAGGSGWCDWGTPARVLESLKQTAHLEPLLRRLARGIGYNLSGVLSRLQDPL
jgi:mannose-1-phosphate guanylyltransferase